MAARTLFQIIESALVGRTVRFLNIPDGQDWINDTPVLVEGMEFDFDGDDFVTVIDFTLRRLSDGETLHLFDAPLDTVFVEVIEEGGHER